MNESLPGQDLIVVGLQDLTNNRETIQAMLVCIGAPNLRLLGFTLPGNTVKNPEHKLYDLLATEDSDSAHSRYNALLRRLVSFERAAQCVKR